MKTYKARIHVNGRYMDATVQAGNPLDAKTMLEAQYGKGCIHTGPFEAR